jgi:uncharacterized coiled-coil protein SlyX
MDDWDNLVEPTRGALEALLRKGDAMADRIEELEAKLADQIEWVKRLADDLNAAEGREARLKAKLEQALRALERIKELEAKLAKAEWLLCDAMVQLRDGKIRTRRNRAGLIEAFLEELKGQNQ